MIAALVGGQFGSEGKGLIAGHIAKDFDVHVRVGAANAGHTLWTLTDTALGYERHVMQQIPCAAYANPGADLVIGPGALISPLIFFEELSRLQAWRARRGLAPITVFVDRRAHVITDEQIEDEQRTGLAERIGSTSTIAREGIGVAAADRVLRAARCVVAQDYFDPDVTPDVGLVDAPMQLHHAHRAGARVLLEGTQGTGLSNTTGFFPYTTSRNTTAAGLAADAGVAPGLVERVILVCRTFPIRVAGPSGPFWPDSREITWEEIGVDPENERTTVTKKVRRVATFSYAQIVHAAAINGATEIALTFADYIEPALACAASPRYVLDQEALSRHPDLEAMIADLQAATGLPVTYVGTGPHHVVEPAESLAERVERAA